MVAVRHLGRWHRHREQKLPAWRRRVSNERGCCELASEFPPKAIDLPPVLAGPIDAAVYSEIVVGTMSQFGSVAYQLLGARPLAPTADLAHGRNRPFGHRGATFMAAARAVTTDAPHLAKAACTAATTCAPSPTAAATRLTEPERTSPIANTSRRLVSSGRRPAAASAPVSTNPLE